MSGVIYAITSPSEKRYIGSAKNFPTRRRVHLWALRKGCHHSAPLQRAWNKYGGDGFVFSVMLVCEEKDLFFYEQICLDNLKPEYNVNPSACGTRGLKWSEESKAKNRKSRTAEQRDNVRRGMFAAFTKEELAAKTAHARSFLTEESEKARIAKLTGRKDTPETCARKSAKLRGHVVSEETREKLAAQRGWKHSDEALAKMRAAKMAKRALIGSEVS